MSKVQMSIEDEETKERARTYTQSLFCQIDIGDLDQFAAKNGNRAVIHDSVRDSREGLHQVREAPAGQ